MHSIKIGRASENDIVIDDQYISNFHIKLYQDDTGEIYIQDLNSSNGTFINGIKIDSQAYKLSKNDSVKIGHTLIAWNVLFEKKTDTKKVLSYQKLFWFIVSVIAFIGFITMIIWYNNYVVKPKTIFHPLNKHQSNHQEV